MEAATLSSMAATVSGGQMPVPVCVDGRLAAGYVVVHQLRIDDVGDRNDGCRAPPG
ncbi:hypothetical protein [Streptomyces yanii]|uniref:Uncharacterized protein n=1 Tax=Streptomyces yanii TaxID=78510 RepID=A0ABV5RN62_9ACTN